MNLMLNLIKVNRFKSTEFLSLKPGYIKPLLKLLKDIIKGNYKGDIIYI